MRMRIEPLPGREDEITCALVFAPVTQTPAAPVLLIQRPDAQDGVLGRRGWAVASNGLRPRLVERRGDELWAMFGSELSWHVQRGTPIAVRERDGELAGRAIWPAIARGRQPPMPIGEEEEAPPPPSRPAPVPPPVAAPPVAPPPVAPPVAPPLTQPVPPETPLVTRDPGPRTPWLWMVLPLLLLAGGGGYWWMTREQPPVPVPPPAPAPSPAPQASPAPPADPCLDLPTILTACPRERLATLPPEVQTRLAEGLLGMEGRPALGLGLSLLITAANRHGPAQMALARLYDPAHFRPGGAVSAANPARALDLYRDAAAASIAGAAEARGALVERLRREAAGEGEAAERARTVLRQAGIE